MTRPDFSELEEAIAAVEGVATATVRAEGQSARGSLRITLRPGVDAEAVARSVSGELRERFGIHIDPAAIRPRSPVSEVAAPRPDGDGPAEQPPAEPEPPTAAEAPAAPVATVAEPRETPARAVEAAAEDVAEAGEVAEAPVEAAEVDEGAEEPPPPAAEPDAPQEEAPAAQAEAPPPPQPETRVPGPTAPAQSVGADLHRANRVPPWEEVLTPVNGPAGEAAPPTGQATVEVTEAARPVVRSLQVGEEGLVVTAEAVIALDGAEVRGSASAAATFKAGLRAVARATLVAVEQLLTVEAKLELESLAVDDDGEDARVVVTVTCLTHDGPEKLIGAALVRDDAEDAAMRATLDAVNRRIGRLLGAAAD